MSPILLTIALVMFIYILYSFVTTKGSKNFPPGPLRIPFLGGYLQMLLEDYNYPHIALSKMSKKYNSQILGFYLGSERIIVANSYETCREILLRPEFQGRVDGIIPRARALGKKLGIFFDDGDDWLHQRRFTLREMRDFGFGRRSDAFEQVLDEEITDMLEEIRKTSEKGESIAVPDTFYPVMINCIYHLLIGSRVPSNEREKLKEMGKLMMKFQRSTDATGRILTLIPSLKNVAPEKTGYNDCVETSVQMWNFMKDKVQQHISSFDNELKRDYIDAYFDKIGKEPRFSEDHLTMCCIDLTFPATAAATAVSLALMFMVENPSVLSKCQEEIDSVVGRGRNVTLNDRQYLPYTEATFREVLRKIPVAPLGVFHKTTEDTTFFGFDVPKDTLMVTNLWAMHRDEKIYQDPENFRPERFLDCRGNLRKKDYTLPFGLGKRVCAGETFARQNIFITMANIFQNYNVIGDSKVHFNEIHPGLIINLRDDFYIKLIMRD